MLRTVLHFHQSERLPGALAPRARGQAAVDQRELDVLQDVELGQQIEELENKTDFLIADAGQFAG